METSFQKDAKNLGCCRFLIECRAGPQRVQTFTHTPVALPPHVNLCECLSSAGQVPAIFTLYVHILYPHSRKCLAAAGLVHDGDVLQLRVQEEAVCLGLKVEEGSGREWAGGGGGEREAGRRQGGRKPNNGLEWKLIGILKETTSEAYEGCAFASTPDTLPSILRFTLCMSTPARARAL